MIAARNIDAAGLRRMLAERAGAAAPARGEAEAGEFDWTRPCRFSRTALAELNAAVAALAEAVGERLSALLRTELELHAQPPEQLYASALRKDQADAAAMFRAALARDGQSCGHLAVEPAQGRRWVARLLGAAGEDEADGRELSGLERELLGDVLGGVAAELSSRLKAAGGEAVALHGGVENPGSNEQDQRDENQQTDDLGADNAEYCRVKFRPGPEQQDAAVLVLTLRSELLEPLAGRKPAPRKADGDAAVREHFARMVLAAEVRVGTARLTMGEALALAGGDVVLLDEHPRAAPQVIVEGKPLLRCAPVVCEGRYGVRIVGPVEDVAKG